MFTKLLGLLAALFCLLPAAYAIDASKLLPPEQAFVPQVQVSEQGINVQFAIAEGYYLYQQKISADTQPALLSGEVIRSEGQVKEDEFFGKQTVYHRAAQLIWPYKKAAAAPYTLTLTYQGCAEAGVCYPPSQTRFTIQGNGVYQPENQPAATGKQRFLTPDTSSQPAGQPAAASRFTLSWDTLNANLLAFFLTGLGLSFTACMYPLIPIVSSIVIGDRHSSRSSALALTVVYTQGLALTYTLVGVLAGLTGALLTVWLQQPWVVLSAAALLVLLALSMFGLFTIQLPNTLQSYFQQQSNKLSGGKLASVFGMGMFSALIVGPCVAPPLAAALGYIGQTGDAVLGGLALYAMALGTGVPLILIGTFGAHILPKAGKWMDMVKYAFGFILLGAAIYLATPYLPYGLTAALYSLLMVVPAGLLLTKHGEHPKSLKCLSMLLGSLLLAGGLWFGWQSSRNQTTALHTFLTLHPQSAGAESGTRHYTSVAELKTAMASALKADPNTPVMLDFYADWCVSCKEMAANTLNQPEVAAAVPLPRLFTIDVTANQPEHQALLKEYGLYGPPGIFVLHSDGRRSEALLGYVKPDAFIQWYRAQR